MEKIRFAVIGSGWRALFYIRLAKVLPHLFELTHVLVRTEERAKQLMEDYGAAVTLSREIMLEAKPDFVVIAINKAGICAMIEELVKLGVAVLAETPPALSIEDLERLWNVCKDRQGRVQVAEQYFLYPLFAAKLEALGSGIIGVPYCLTISAAHDYHAISLIRKFLGTGFENVKIYGEKFTFPVTETDSRYGITYDGLVVPKERDRVTLKFESGKIAFYDFSGVQYHSYIRSRHINIQSAKGELEDEDIRFLNALNEPVVQRFHSVLDAGEGSHLAVTLGDKTVFKSPFPKMRLNDDEIAIGTCLLGMKRYLENGQAFYSFADALQDAYLALLMKEALDSPGHMVSSQSQVWVQS